MSKDRHVRPGSSHKTGKESPGSRGLGHVSPRHQNPELRSGATDATLQEVLEIYTPYAGEKLHESERVRR